MTITSLERYRERTDRRTVAYYASATQAAADLLDFHVRLSGLGGSAAGVFVQGVDDETLRPIRLRMREAASELHDGDVPAMAFIRDTAHISLSVHRHQLPEPGEVQLVESMRAVPFGTIDGAHVAVVEYRARAGSMSMQLLKQVR